MFVHEISLKRGRAYKTVYAGWLGWLMLYERTGMTLLIFANLSVTLYICGNIFLWHIF